MRLPTQGVDVVGEVRELGLCRRDDLLDGQFAARCMLFGDGAEGVIGLQDAAAIFDSFGRPISGGEQLQQVAEVLCNDATLTLGAEVGNRLVDDRGPWSD